MTDRLAAERNVWIATVRADGRPHLVPVWYVVHDDRWYICTAPGSVKARNIAHSPHVALALEDGNDAYVVAGIAAPVEPPAEVARAFRAKYDWNITTDDHYTQTYAIEITGRIMG
ncbi:MAG: pyridoxamine 5'-phosphate oxidase family protein [Anaerolineales bacterium]